eukprot:Hpha_TRINITY_DN16687_c2_g11::TRINITY_DN16687_c2_g11_i2::g.182751::m.182751
MGCCFTMSKEVVTDLEHGVTLSADRQKLAEYLIDGEKWIPTYLKAEGTRNISVLTDSDTQRDRVGSKYMYSLEREYRHRHGSSWQSVSGVVTLQKYESGPSQTEIGYTSDDGGATGSTRVLFTLTQQQGGTRFVMNLHSTARIMWIVASMVNLDGAYRSNMIRFLTAVNRDFQDTNSPVGHRTSDAPDFPPPPASEEQPHQHPPASEQHPHQQQHGAPPHQQQHGAYNPYSGAAIKIGQEPMESSGIKA